MKTSLMPKINRLFIAFFVLCFSSSICLADLQLTARSNRVAADKFSTQSIWNITITSSLSQPETIFLEGQISDQDGRPVARISSTSFTINPGITNLDQNTLSTKFLRYLNNDLGRYEVSNGHLPSGNYAYCIVVVCAKNCIGAIGELSGESILCDQVIAVNQSPLLLSLPFDEATLKKTRPNFSWIPPMPLGSDPDLTYNFTLVELKQNQSAESGLRRNRPIYKLAGIPMLTLPFPAELEVLKIGQDYGWRVEAMLGKTVVQTSESWEFEIIDEKRIIQPMPFVRLKKEDSDIYTTLNELKFIYNERNRSSQLDYSIVSADGEIVDVSSLILSTKRGENKYKIDLTQFVLQPEKNYTLRVRDQTGFEYTLRFVYYFGS